MPAVSVAVAKGRLSRRKEGEGFSCQQAGSSTKQKSARVDARAGTMGAARRARKGMHRANPPHISATSRLGATQARGVDK